MLRLDNKFNTNYPMKMYSIRSSSNEDPPEIVVGIVLVRMLAVNLTNFLTQDMLR